MQSSREKFELERCKGFPGGASAKEPACQCRIHKRCGFNAWVGKVPWRRKWQHTPVFLPGESHGQRNLEGCSPWGRKEVDTSEATLSSCAQTCAIITGVSGLSR